MLVLKKTPVYGQLLKVQVLNLKSREEFDPVARCCCSMRFVSTFEWEVGGRTVKVQVVIPSRPRKQGVRRGTAILRTKILHVFALDSIRILFSRGEIPQHLGNSRGCSTRRILICEMLALKMAVWDRAGNRVWDGARWIRKLRIRKLRIAESESLGDSPWAWEFLTLKSRFCLSQTLWKHEKFNLEKSAQPLRDLNFQRTCWSEHRQRFWDLRPWIWICVNWSYENWL